MKVLTDKRRQWFWFAALWCGGLIAALLISYAVRWIISVS
jgi:hypothetical protein